MSQSEVSSTWEVLSRGEPASPRSTRPFPTSPTSPSFPITPRSAQIKGPSQTITERLGKLSIEQHDQPIPQGHQVRNVSTGSVESGSSAWGTLASKSILSRSHSKKEKSQETGEHRTLRKEKQRENKSKKESSEKIEKTRKVRSVKETGLDPTATVEANQSGHTVQPGSPARRPSSAHAHASASDTSALLMELNTGGPVDHPVKKKKSRRSGRKKSSKATGLESAAPETPESRPISPISTTYEPTALELWSEVQSQPGMSSVAGVTSVADMSIAEMTSQHRKSSAKRRGKKPARGERRRDVETGTQATGSTDASQDLTVAQMVMQAQTAKRAEAQREKRKRASARKLADRQQGQGPSGSTGPAAAESDAIGTETNVVRGEDNFRAEPAAGAYSSFRLVRGTPEATGGTSEGTATDSGVLLPNRAMRRKHKARGDTKQATTDSQANSPHEAGSKFGPGGGSSSVSFPRTTPSADPLYSGYLVVDPSDGSGSVFDKFSTSNESVAPHHSVSRRGSPGPDAGHQRLSNSSAVIIGLEALHLNQPNAVPLEPAPEQVKETQQKRKNDSPANDLPSRNAVNAGAPTPTELIQQERTYDDDDHDVHSVTTYEEAHSSVRAYLAQDPEFLADTNNKLCFWQGLCIELGLALPATTRTVPPSPALTSQPQSDADSSEDELIHRNPSKRRQSSSTTTTISTASDRTAMADKSSRCSTPRPVIAPVPTTRTGCLWLLKTHAHINLRDWFDARQEVDERLAEARRRKGSALDHEDMDSIYEPLRRLMFPSTSKMIKYTCENRRFVNKKVLKAAWLEPLMRDMHFGGSGRA